MDSRVRRLALGLPSRLNPTSLGSSRSPPSFCDMLPSSASSRLPSRARYCSSGAPIGAPTASPLWAVPGISGWTSVSWLLARLSDVRLMANSRPLILATPRPPRSSPVSWLMSVTVMSLRTNGVPK